MGLLMGGILRGRLAWGVAALCGLMLAAGCSRPAQEAALACPPAKTPPVGPEAIDRVMDDAMADVVARRATPDPEARQAARRAVVRSCLENVASTQPLSMPLQTAAGAVVKACSSVIDRFNKAETTDATFRGVEPPSLDALMANRSAFHAEAEQLISEMRAGRCP